MLIKALAGIIAAAALTVGVGATAFAASPSQEECEASGGTFSREQGTVTCTTSENVGNSENSETVETTESSKGTLKNQPHHEESCDGPGNSGDSSAHCP